MPRARPARKARRWKAVAVLAGATAATIAAAWFFSDCILSLITPSGGARVTRSIAYAPGPRGTLDVYAPKNAVKAPVVVFFYGGRWQFGRKGLYAGGGNALASRGAIVIIPDYRVYPEVGFPDFLKDGAKAVLWAKQNAARFGGDPDRIFIMGHSAGAHIAAMLALDPQFLASEGMDAKHDIAGLIGLSGPYDFLPLDDPELIKLFGGANRAETQPITFAGPGAPPAFLGTGAADETVSPLNTEHLAQKLRASGVRVEEKIYPGRSHMGMILPFLGPLRFLAPVLDDVTRFIQATPSRAG
jgi:acetyl esterase/lipase